MSCPLPDNLLDRCNTGQNSNTRFWRYGHYYNVTRKKMVVILLLSFLVIIVNVVNLEVYILSDLFTWV